MVLRVKDEQVAWVYALTDETWKMTSGFTVACMLHELVGLSVAILAQATLAQAAVSVQNPPSGSQTCFPGGWVR